MSSSYKKEEEKKEKDDIASEDKAMYTATATDDVDVVDLNK